MSAEHDHLPATTDRVPATYLRKQTAEALGRVEFGDERLIITRNGREVGALVSMEDFEELYRRDVPDWTDETTPTATETTTDGHA